MCEKSIFSKLSGIFFLIAILTGVFARLYGISNQSLWADEICTQIFSSMNLKEMFQWLIADVHPPLYYVIMHYWINLFGDSELALRFPSVIVGILIPFFMYVLTRKIFDNYIAASSTIIITLSGTAIHYSQEARMYSFLLLFSIISTLIWLSILKNLKNENLEKKELITYGIVCLLTSYLHYFGVALIFFQIIYLIFASYWFKKGLKGILFLAYIIGAIFLPWFLLHIIILKSLVGGNFWIAKPGIEFFIGLITFIFTKKIVLILLLLPFLVKIKAFIKGLRFEIKDLKPDSSLISLLYLIFIPIIVFCMISQHTPILIHRYLIILLPAIYLLIPVLLSIIPEIKGARTVIYVFIVSLTGIVLFLYPNLSKLEFTSYYQIPNKQQWREATQYIIDNSTKDSLIFADKPMIVYNYYFKKLNKNKKELIIKEKLSEKDFHYIEQNKYKKVFVLSFMPPAEYVVKIYEIKGKKQRNRIKRNSVKQSKKDFMNLTVYEYSYD